MPSEEEIGLRVTLRDRREAISGLQDVRDEVTGAGDDADDAGRRAERSGGRWSSLGGAVKKAGKIAAIGAGLIVAAGVGATKALYGIGATFDDLGDTIRVGTGATGKQLDSLVGSAKRIGKDIPVAFEEIGPAVADINTRLGLTGPVLETLSKQTLMAGELMGEAIDVNKMSGAFSAFGVEGERTTKAMDSIYQISQATGVGMNELLDIVGKQGPMLQQFGFGFEESAAWIGTLDKAGLGSKKTVATLGKAMGKFAKDGLEPQKALQNVIGEIEKFTKAGDEAGAVTAASEIFGAKAAVQFVAAVKSGKVELDNLVGATGKTSDTILKAGEDTADFAEQWQLFKNRALLAVEPIATRVFGAIGDGMDRINKDVVPMVQNFIAEMKSGKGAGGRFADVLERAKDIAVDVGTAIKDLGGFLVKHKGYVIGAAIAIGLLVAVTKVHNAVMAIQAAGGLMAMIKSLPIVTAMTSAWTAVQWLLNAAMAANPITLVVLAIVALIAILAIAWAKSETFRNVVTGAFEKVKEAAVAVKDWVVEKFTDMVNWFSGIGGKITGAVSGMWEGLKSAAGTAKDWVVEKFTGMLDWFGGLPEKITTLASGMWDGISSTFKDVINILIDAWNSIDFGINISVPDWVPGVGGKGFKVDDIIPDIPRLADGGIVRRQLGGIIANIGEGRHDEAVVPLNGRRYLIDGAGVTPLPPLQGSTDADIAAQVDTDTTQTLPPAAAGHTTLVVPVSIDGREIAKVVVDDIESKVARL